MATKLGRILVVDDEVNARSALAELLRDEGYEVETAADAFKALGKVAEFAPHVVLTDLKMPGMDGIELVAELRKQDPSPDIIVMTAFGGVASAVEAMRKGARDYLTKPLNFEELLISLERTVEGQSLRVEAAELRKRVTDRVAPKNIVGASPSIQRVFEVVDQVAPSRATVLITGESGTGKELIANAIHERSPRAGGAFVKLHCAALAESLLESELFGHEKGAFTGAVNRRDGRFSMADGGTLFLDELGDISPNIQVKLLRVLQEQEFERVGSNTPTRVDVRLIAATNQDLMAAVRAGRFREDLYYRLNVVAIEMPPLRDRLTDLPLLAQHFLHRFAVANQKQITGISAAAMNAMNHHRWPGNVRELENMIERAVVMTKGSTIELGDLPALLSELVQSSASAAGGNAMPPIPGAKLADIEKYAILETLKATGGSTSKTAEMLGVGVRTIQYRLHEYSSGARSSEPVVAPTKRTDRS
ncbi:MAG: sigma-54-dependent Fis family transcriptional regulator [Myxococcales bacterium]|nr:sigma-54-dependent Fis family transcriptional regulator [Myxococcales bacterium]